MGTAKRIDWKRFNEFINVCERTKYNTIDARKFWVEFYTADNEMIVYIYDDIALHYDCICLDDGTGDDTYTFVNNDDNLEFYFAKKDVVSIEYGILNGTDEAISCFVTLQSGRKIRLFDAECPV